MKQINFICDEFINVIQSTKNLSRNTVLAYSSDLKDFCEYLKNEEMGEYIVLSYVKYLFQERKLQDSTINRKLIVLKSFFLYLHNKGYIEDNYYQKHIFKFKKERKLPKTLAVKETARLLDKTNQLYVSAKTNYEKMENSSQFSTD